MGLYAADFKEYLKRPGPTVFPYIRVVFPGVGSRYYRSSRLGAASEATIGLIKAKVRRWGQLQRAVSGRDGSLSPATLSLVVDDTDFEFAKLLDSANGSQVRRSPADVTLATPDLPSASWPLLCRRMVLESWQQVAPLAYEWQIRSNDQWLRQPVPRKTISPADWRNAEPQLYGKHAPLVIGKHDSAGSGKKGMVPTMLVDTANFVYAISLCRMKAVPVVYKADGSVAASSGYTITYPVVNGYQWTCIDFTADPSTDAIFCDVEGVETVGDGSGTLITNPADLLKWILVNFLYNDYKTGNYFSVTAATPIESSMFTTLAAYCTAKGIKGSRRYGEDESPTGHEVLAEWCASFGWRSFWTVGGRLAALPYTHVLPSAARTWLKWDRDGRNRPPQFPSPTLDFVSRLTVQYVLESASGSYLSSLELKNPRFAAIDEVTRALTMPCSYAAVI